MRFHKLEACFDEFVRLWECTPASVQTWRDALRSSQKFFVGDVARVPPSSFVIQEYPRLPYPLTAFELEIGETRLILIVADTRVRVCFEIFIGYARDEWAPFGSVRFTRGAPGWEEGFHRLLLPKLNAESMWAKQVRAFRGGEGDTVSPGPGDLSSESAVLWSGVGIVGQFLKVLNCVNVKTEMVVPAARLARKRAASGKPPIYEYKVLVLGGRGKARAGVLGGTHASPRVHLRRGHIKHRKSGDYWWEPCVVGDRSRGVVVKDYSAELLLT